MILFPLNLSYLVANKILLATYTGNRVLPGRAYRFMGWTKLLDRKKTGDVHSLELWIRFKKRGEKKQKSKRLAHRTKYSQGWWDIFREILFNIILYLVIRNTFENPRDVQNYT